MSRHIAGACYPEITKVRWGIPLWVRWLSDGRKVYVEGPTLAHMRAYREQVEYNQSNPVYIDWVTPWEPTYCESDGTTSRWRAS